VADAGDISFSNARLREIVHDGVDPAHRRETHRKAAQVYEQLAGPEPGEVLGPITYHFERSDDTGKAGFYREKLQALLGPAAAGDPERRDHDALFAALEKQRGEACVPDKTYVRFVDGQLTWREREEVERHLENCFYCLNRFAEFREVAHFFHVLPPADDAAVAELAAALGLPGQKPRAKKLPWWQRLLGG